MIKNIEFLVPNVFPSILLPFLYLLIYVKIPYLRRFVLSHSHHPSIAFWTLLFSLLFSLCSFIAPLLSLFLPTFSGSSLSLLLSSPSFSTSIYISCLSFQYSNQFDSSLFSIFFFLLVLTDENQIVCASEGNIRISATNRPLGHVYVYTYVQNVS